jgi:hypothetical protein
VRYCSRSCAARKALIFGRDLRAARARADQRHAELVRGDVRLPHAQAGRIHLADEQRALERGVVARDHREGVEAEDVAG